MKRLILSLIIVLLLVTPCLADEVYKAQILSAYDADTMTAEFVLPFNIYVVEKIRLDGIDTPEIKGKTEAEGKLAIEARDFVRGLVVGKIVEVNIVKQEKFGRWLCEVFIDGKSLNELLIEKGYAREYHGERREDWDL